MRSCQPSMPRWRASRTRSRQRARVHGRAAQRVPGYSGPAFGAKLADANVREFSEETRIKGAAQSTFLGKGSYGCATAAGMFDTSKEIVKSTADCWSTPTMVGMGSHGHASQAGMDQVRRRDIVKAC